MVADGLGHGLLAAEAARAAVSCLMGQPEGNLIDVLERAHSKLRSTRGAAVAVADVDFRARRVIFACVGNITGVIVSSAGVRRQLVSMNGTAGHGVSRFRQFEYPCEHGSLLILHSDGLSSNWAFEKYPGLLQRHPSVIAAVLFRDFRRTKDDATVVVIRGGLQ
jgi:serine phosphatase RsbU (regulator of sigma subunit)